MAAADSDLHDYYLRFTKGEIPESLREDFSERRWRHNRRFLRIVSFLDLFVAVLLLLRLLFFFDAGGIEAVYSLYLLNFTVLIGLSALYLGIAFCVGRRGYAPLCRYAQRAYIIAIAVNYCFLTYIDLQIAPDFSAAIGLIVVLSVIVWLDAASYLAILVFINALVVLGFALGVHPSVSAGELAVEMVLFSVVGAGLFFVINDGRTRNFVSERLLEKSVEKLEYLSRRDSLTELYNRRLMIEDIEGQLALSQRNGQAFSILLMDLDKFKRVNDGLGHVVGDEVIKMTASILTSSVRESDRIYRYGGEEFLVLLPDTLPEKAVRLAERLLIRFRECAFPGVPWPITMSMGLSGSGERRLAEDLVKLADLRLYAAKEAGRDRCVAEGFSGAAENGVAEIPVDSDS